MACCFTRVVVCFALSCGLVWYWGEVDSDTGPFAQTGYRCHSDLSISSIHKASLPNKGLAVDDETFGCADKVPTHWPNTEEKVSNLRLFRSELDGWNLGQISSFNTRIADYARANKVKILVGTKVTCDPVQDESDWEHTKTLLKYLGPDHVLGLAVGNEIDQLASKKGTTQECVDTIWGSDGGGYLFTQLKKRILEVRALSGYEKLPVTTVFTAAIVWDTGGAPFKNDDKMKTNSFFQKIKDDPQVAPFVYTFNFYPYFDPTLTLDSDGGCATAVKKCSTFTDGSGANMVNMIQARKALTTFTGNPNAAMWTGEVGWSAPTAETLHTEMAKCDAFSSYKMLHDYYSAYLQWDQSLPSGTGPEISFYFSIRDSGNFGDQEHFGLIEKCGYSDCKLTKSKVGGSSGTFVRNETAVDQSMSARTSLTV